MNKLADIRKEYTKGNLHKENLKTSPFQQFNDWLQEALKAKCNEPTAVTLATVDEDLMPNCRIVLLKDVQTDGFVFFTNYNSKKGQELSVTNKAALNFFWPELERQVRIRGTIKKVPSLKSDEYFQSRPRESQLGAWASNQSQVVEDSQQLTNKFEQLKKQYEDQSIPRPAHWGGYILEPISIEFWQGKANRMHDRFQYHLEANSWIIRQLAP
ncbi:pyridoxamine 5'-phosphate oxidase [Carboxylicivirga mesophila]|uniref:Pyridoxine/pyridoxamine 5'-phosphate oxidase n=1 Tax=Carboxylicivirga mesophila TaxID=1166478 RepID=A0ABS5K6M9_9BACT|nr:pyridoxamine 5'-phosphate oxidase [Carboxylicivirga mesophila]MBS2210621.1 pyridoxamine 5'-phosphate oxidase [Carboxylicivirga mesophila]